MYERLRPPDLYRDGANISFRPATIEDASTLERWDRDPAVISATTDDDDAEKAFGDHDWRKELPKQSAVDFYLIAELDGRPFGAMQIIDPHLEPTRYWGEIEPNLRAIDIWIGEPECRGKGFGRIMMRAAIEGCFGDPAVTAIIIDPLNSNTRAHKFYQRLGFKPTHRQTFNGEDDCLVHRLTREEWEAAL
jgi:aminoglycoside 6'-N-acetyltransferase